MSNINGLARKSHFSHSFHRKFSSISEGETRRKITHKIRIIEKLNEIEHPKTKNLIIYHPYQPISRKFRHDSIPVIHSNRNTITTTNCEKPCFLKKKRKKFFCHKISIRTIKRKNENKILAGKGERSNIKINAKGVKN